MKKSRLEAVSDGVIVIIMTVMVFEIKAPDFSSITGGSVTPFLQHAGVYAMSFLVLAVMWQNHHYIFTGIEALQPRIIWLNFLLLFFMSLIPVPTKTLGENFGVTYSHVFYGIILALNSCAFSLLQHTVNKQSSHITAKEKRSIDIKNWVSVGLYFLSAPLAFISVYLSLAVFILIPAMYFLPSAKLRRADQHI